MSSTAQPSAQPPVSDAAQSDQGAGRRRGGRLARQALRAAPLAEDIRPVRPGMESGRYRVLNDEDILRIHRARRWISWKRSASPTPFRPVSRRSRRAAAI